MANKLPPLERLLMSRSGYSNSRTKSFFLGLCSAIFIATSLWGFYINGAVKGSFSSLFVGTVLLLVLGYAKEIYVSPVGIVKEVKTWRGFHRETVPWEDIKFVTIMCRRDGSSMAFFEKEDILGFKALFGDSQIPELLDILDDYIPDIEVNKMTAKR